MAEELPKLRGFTGEWQPYEDAIYEVFLTTVVRANLNFQGIRISCQYRPESKGKHYSFWHLISEGDDEENRTPDLQRCERIEWIGWIIANAETCSDIVYWNNNRGESSHIVILHKVSRYAVILAERNGYYMLRSAYPVTERRFQKMLAEHKACNSGPRKG